MSTIRRTGLGGVAVGAALFGFALALVLLAGTDAVWADEVASAVADSDVAAVEVHEPTAAISVPAGPTGETTEAVTTAPSSEPAPAAEAASEPASSNVETKSQSVNNTGGQANVVAQTDSATGAESVSAKEVSNGTADGSSSGGSSGGGATDTASGDTTGDDPNGGPTHDPADGHDPGTSEAATSPPTRAAEVLAGPASTVAESITADEGQGVVFRPGPCSAGSNPSVGGCDSDGGANELPGGDPYSLSMSLGGGAFAAAAAGSGRKGSNRFATVGGDAYGAAGSSVTDGEQTEDVIVAAGKARTAEGIAVGGDARAGTEGSAWNLAGATSGGGAPGTAEGQDSGFSVHDGSSTDALAFPTTTSGASESTSAQNSDMTGVAPLTGAASPSAISGGFSNKDGVLGAVSNRISANLNDARSTVSGAATFGSAPGDSSSITVGPVDQPGGPSEIVQTNGPSGPGESRGRE